MKFLVKALMIWLIASFGASAKIERPMIQNLNGIPGITDSRCHLSVSNAVIDYGELSRWQLQEVANGRALTPGKRTLTFNALCPFSQTMRLMVFGDKASNGELRYGDQGKVLMKISDAQLDGKSVQLSAMTSDNRLTGAAFDAKQLKPGERIAATVNGRKAIGKVFSAKIEIIPLMPEGAARVASRQRSEAAMTIELMD